VLGDGHASGGAPAARSSSVNICAVLKQDAYGLGAPRIAKRLSAAGGRGVDMFAVYTVDEARAIFESVPRVPILVLMPVYTMDRMDPLYRCASEGRLHVVLHDAEQLASLNDLAGRLGVSLPVHVQVDTGLTRGGESPEHAAWLVEQVVQSSRLLLSGLMTHFASPCCDADFTSTQAERFTQFMELVTPTLRQAIVNGHNPPRPAGFGGGVGESFVGAGGLTELSVHMANSCAMFRSRSHHGTMVRVGQCLYGFALEDSDRRGEVTGRGPGFEFADQASRLESCVRWVSYAAHVQEIETGWPVGYGSTWRAPKRVDGKRSRIAIIPIGYADGYPRSLGGASEKRGGGPGWVGFTGRAFDRRGAGGGEPDEPSPANLTSRVLGASGAFESGDGATGGVIFAPVVGRVSMDQITVDVTDVPEQFIRVAGGAGGGSAGNWGEVEVYGRDRTAPNYLPTLASAGGTITHELLCRVSPRVERVYRYPATTSQRPFSTGGAIVAGEHAHETPVIHAAAGQPRAAR
jgi:alanine racemase